LAAPRRAAELTAEDALLTGWALASSGNLALPVQLKSSRAAVPILWTAFLSQILDRTLVAVLKCDAAVSVAVLEDVARLAVAETVTLFTEVPQCPVSYLFAVTVASPAAIRIIVVVPLGAESVVRPIDRTWARLTASFLPSRRDERDECCR